MNKDIDFLIKLEKVIEDRKKNLPSESYTTKLFQRGLDRILRKIGEESGELIIAGKNEDKKEIVSEAADLVYHLLVFLHSQDLQLADVVAVLSERHKS